MIIIKKLERNYLISRQYLFKELKNVENINKVLIAIPSLNQEKDFKDL